MKNKRILKILGVALTLAMVFSLGAIFTAAPVAADDDEWSAYDLPLADADGDWFMDDAITTVGPIVRDIDGYFWAYVEQGADTDEIYKSLDTEGRTWDLTMYSDATDGVAGTDVLAMAPSTLDADVLYAIDAAAVYKTEDGGDSWSEVGDFDTDVIETLTTLAVGWDSEGDARVFVGTADKTVAGFDDGDTQGIFYLYDIAFGTDWTDLALDGMGDADRDDISVLGLAVSPDFADDAFIAALVTNHEDVDTHVAWHVGSNPGGWTSVDLETAAEGAWESDFGSDPVFPADFNGDDFADGETEIFVGYSDIAGIDGGVSRVYGTADDAEEQLDDVVGTDIISLDAVGNLGSMQFLAGEAGEADVWYSSDDGDNWESALAEGINPAGAANTYVVIDADYDGDEGIGWAATSAAEGGLSMTIDGGTSWQGISLLDTEIADLNAAAIVGDTVYILTDLGDESDLFRYDGAWTRLYQEAQYGLGDMDMIGIFEDTIVLAASTGADIAFSTDGGQMFGAPDETPASIASLLVLDDETWWVGDTDGDLWVTDDAGDRSWDEYEIDAVAVDITSLAVSGDTALAGTAVSEVWYSEDAGETWDQVDTGNDIDGDNAATYVTFDSDDDNIAYAAADDTLARFTDLSDLDGDWEAFDTDINFADGNGDGDFTDAGDTVYLFDTASGIASMDGVLYASSGGVFNSAGTAEAGGFMRVVNPLSDLDDVDDSNVDGVADGLDTGTDDEFDGGLLITSGSTVLWAIDVDEFTLWTYTDLMVGPATGIIADPGDTDYTLSWDGFANATDYEVWVYEDEDMRAVYEEYADDTGDDDPLLIDTTGVTAGTQYWVMVRGSAPVHSKWSDVFTFWTGPGAVGIDEDTLAPSLGALNVPTDTPFSWGFNAAAESYTIEISDTADFSNILDSATVTVPAYQSSVTLQEGTNYWFRVNSTAGGQDGDPAYSNFTTMTTPPAPPAPPAPAPAAPATILEIPVPTTPNYIYAIIGIGAALAILVIVLIVKTRKQ